MFLFKETIGKPTKGPIGISSDVYATPKVPIQLALIEIKNSICHLDAAFHWISLSQIPLPLMSLESLVKLHSLTLIHLV